MNKCKRPALFGIGNSGGVSTTNPDGTTSREYRLWYHILERSYCENYHARKPTYINCEVSEEFRSFGKFKEWCAHQKGFGKIGFYLDKDLLIKGNKTYSPDTCIFIPQEINNALTTRKASRGIYPIGVSKNNTNDMYISSISIDGKKIYLGTKFKTINEAFVVYKSAKQDHLRRLAIRYKDVIDEKAFYALINYNVDITD